MASQGGGGLRIETRSGEPPFEVTVAPHAGETDLVVTEETTGARRMLDHRAAGPSFESIVAAGANSAVPHHRTTDAALQPTAVGPAPAST